VADNPGVSLDMQIRVIDLDGAVTKQDLLLKRFQTGIADARIHGPRIRLACLHRAFDSFEKALGPLLGGEFDERPALTFYGSGDFHHVTLALLRRQTVPFNLLVLDKHPDWVRGIPFLHCGTWLAHALRLPLLQNIFHVGGELDFDNYFRWMAPWGALHSGKIIVLPAIRRFESGHWKDVPHSSLRIDGETVLKPERLEMLLRPQQQQLSVYPLYISLDKDVMPAADAAVNWDSGHLNLVEVCTVLQVFLKMAQGRLLGMDLLGDWSPVRISGWLRRCLHRIEHPSLCHDAEHATALNECTNVELVDHVLQRSCAHNLLTRGA
jgi:hypothetical protein